MKAIGLAILLFFGFVSQPLSADADSPPTTCQTALAAAEALRADADALGLRFAEVFDGAYAACEAVGVPIQLRQQGWLLHGAVLETQAKLEEAQAWFELSIERLEDAEGLQSASLPEFLTRLATVSERRRGRDDADRQTYERALAISEFRYGKVSPEAVHGLCLLGSWHQAGGDATAAERVYREARSRADSLPANQSNLRGVTLLFLRDLLRDQTGREAEIEELDRAFANLP